MKIFFIIIGIGAALIATDFLYKFFMGERRKSKEIFPDNNKLIKKSKKR